MFNPRLPSRRRDPRQTLACHKSRNTPAETTTLAGSSFVFRDRTGVTRRIQRWLPLERSNAWVLLLALVLRLGALIAVGSFTDYDEFTSDARMHLGLLERPFSLLLGEFPRLGQHPPLLPVCTALFVLPLGWLFSDFVSLRVALIAYDLIGVGLLLRVLPDESSASRWVKWLLAGNPIAIMTCAVMAQDEAIAGAFVAGSLWLWRTDRTVGAAFLSGLGVVAGKIFLLALWLPLVLTARQRGRAVVFGLLPILSTYAVQGLGTIARGTAAETPLTFTPAADFGVNFWVLLLQAGLPIASARAASIALVFAMSSVPLFFLLRDPHPDRAPLVAACWLAALLTGYYHVNPEYFVPLVVLLAATDRALPVTSTALVLGSLLWGVNFAYGVSNALLREVSDGRRAFVDLFASLGPAWFERVQTTLILLGSALSFVLLGWLSWRLRRSRPDTILVQPKPADAMAVEAKRAASRAHEDAD